MPLFRPSEIIEFLRTIDQKAKPTLSQNFLIDGNIVHKILSTLQPIKELPVIEIGPGPGVVTEQLGQLGVSVIAIEKDGVFAQELSRLDPLFQWLHVIHADILQWSLSHQAYVVSNIPYHITTPILEWLMDHAIYIPRAVIMVQREVAHKICGIGKPMYIHMALSFFFRMTCVTQVSPNSFLPRPHVTSAVVLLERVASPPCHKEQFFTLLKLCFEHRRKTIVHALSPIVDPKRCSMALQSIGVSTLARVDLFSFDMWIKFFVALS